MPLVHTQLGPLHVDHFGAGPTLLCWPSLFCDARTLRPLVDEFSRDFHVVLVDGPGHGRSRGPTRSFTLEESADAAMEVLDAVGGGQAIWIGSAWGGNVGVVAALRHPERLLGLVVMNSPMAAWTGSRRLKHLSLYWMFRTFGRPRHLAEEVAKAMLAPMRRAAHPWLMEPIIDCMLQSPREPFFAAVRSAMLERPSLLPKLSGIRVPTLYLTGEEDDILPVEEARAQAMLIPGVQFEVVTGSAHLSVWERPDIVRPKLRTFVSLVSQPLLTATLMDEDPTTRSDLH